MPLEQPRWLEKAVRQLLQLLAAQLHRCERDWEGERSAAKVPTTTASLT